MKQPQKKGLRQQPPSKPHSQETTQVQQVEANAKRWRVGFKVAVSLRRAGRRARPLAAPCYRGFSGFAAVGGVGSSGGMDDQPTLDLRPGIPQSFAASRQTVAGFDSPMIKGNSNAAFLQIEAAFLLSIFWLNQLVGRMLEGFCPAVFLWSRSVNSHSARLFRLTAMKAGTSTKGAK